MSRSTQQIPSMHILTAQNVLDNRNTSPVKFTNTNQVPSTQMINTAQKKDPQISVPMLGLLAQYQSQLVGQQQPESKKPTKPVFNKLQSNNYLDAQSIFTDKNNQLSLAYLDLEEFDQAGKNDDDFNKPQQQQNDDLNNKIQQKPNEIKLQGPQIQKQSSLTSDMMKNPPNQHQDMITQSHISHLQKKSQNKPKNNNQDRTNDNSPQIDQEQANNQNKNFKPSPQKNNFKHKKKAFGGRLLPIAQTNKTGLQVIQSNKYEKPIVFHKEEHKKGLIRKKGSEDEQEEQKLEKQQYVMDQGVAEQYYQMNLQKQIEQNEKKKKKQIGSDFEVIKKIAKGCSKIASLVHYLNELLMGLFQKCSNFIDNLSRSKLTLEIVWVVSFLLIIWIIYTIITSDSRGISTADTFDDLKQYISYNIIGGGFVFIFYGIVMLSFKNYIFYSVLFFVQAVPSLFVFVYYVYDALVKPRHNIESPGYIDCVFSFGIYFFWLATVMIVEDIKNHFNLSLRNIFMSFWCIVLGAFIIGFTVYTVSTTFWLNFRWGDLYFKVLAGPYLIILALGWVYMHFRFFAPLIQNLPNSLGSEDEQKLKEHLLQEQQEKENKKHVPLVQIVGTNQIKVSDQDDEENCIMEPEDEEKQQNLKNDQANMKKSLDIFNPQDQKIIEQQKIIEEENEKQEQLQKLKEQQAEEDEIKKRQLEKKLLLLKIELQKDKPDPRTSIMLKNYLIIFSSCVLGGSMIALTIIPILEMVHQLESGIETNRFINHQAFFMSVFFVFVVPAITFLSTAFLFCSFSERTKLVWFPICGGLVPVMFFMPLSIVVEEYYQLKPMRNYFSLGPCAIGLYWVCLIFIKIKNWKYTMLINSYVCFFFIVPLAIILPLRSVDYYEEYDQVAEDIEYTLIIIGILLLIMVVFVLLFLNIRMRYRKRKLKEKLKMEGRKEEIEQLEKEEFEDSQKYDISNIFRYDLLDFGLWGNAFGYIFTLTVLIFMNFNKPTYVTLQQTGAVIGMQFVIFFLFIISLIILFLRIIPEKQKTAISFSESITQIIESKGERQQTLDLQHKVLRSILVFSFFYLPAFLIILIIIFRNDENKKFNLITVIIGIPICAIIFYIFYKIKQNFDEFSKSSIPSLVVFCWIFLYLPFTGIIPVSFLYLSQDDEDLVAYERIVIGFVVVLIFLGIALLAIFIHLYFKRKQFEKKFLFVASKVIKKLAKFHIKSDYHVIELMYQGYISKGPEGIKEALINLQKPVYYANVSDKDPDPRFSKIIIDANAYEKLQNRKNIKPNKKRDQCLSKFFYIFCCCYKDYYSKQMQKIGSDDQNGKSQNDLDNVDNQLQKALNQALDKQKLEEEEIEIEEDPWQKTYILQKQFRPMYDKIIEPLRRYDLGQQLEISKPFTNKLIKDIFYIFAWGSSKKFNKTKWIDYLMFKELLVKSAIMPCREIEDFIIDSKYSKYTTYNSKPNSNPITLNRFTELLLYIAKLKYPYEPDDEALGKLCKMWLYPYLLWNLPQLRSLYLHEWDYVLFLLKMYGQHDLYAELVAEDEGYYYKLKKELGLLGKNEMFDNVNLPDLDERLKNRKSKCRRCLDRMKKLLDQFAKNASYFLKSLYMLDKDIKSNGKDDVTMEVNMINNNLLVPQQHGAKRNKNGKGYFHEESPEWPEICDIMVDEIQFQEKEFARLKDEEIGVIELRNNYTNFFVCLFKIFEFIAFGTLAFRPPAEWWEFSELALNILNAPNTEAPFADFGLMFWVGFISSLLFFVIMYKSVVRIKTLRYGYCEAKRKKRIFTYDFFQIQFANFVGHFLYFWILKIAVDSFSCDYAQKPQYLFQDNKLECFTQKHIQYMGLAGLSIFVFYPIGSFLWPNVQYQNRALDIRYDPTYLVVSGQFKFVLTGIISFMAHKEVQLYCFVCSTLLCFIFGAFTNKLKPCLVKKINPLDVGGYFLCGWMHLSALILTIVENWLIPIIILGVGAILIICLAFFNWKIINDMNKKENEAKQKAKREKELLEGKQEDSEEEQEEEEEPEPEVIENHQKIYYENLEKQLAKYEPELLQMTQKIKNTQQVRQKEHQEQLKELERRQKIQKELDAEDIEDGKMQGPKKNEDDDEEEEEKNDKKKKTKQKK